MDDNHKDIKKVLEIHYDEKDKVIDIKFGTTFIPMLCYAIKLAEMQLENLIIEQNINKQKDGLTIPRSSIEGFKL